jgi:hypothetical protein
MGLQVNRCAERRVGRRLQSETRVGAADVGDENGKRDDEICHCGINGKSTPVVKTTAARTNVAVDASGACPAFAFAPAATRRAARNASFSANPQFSIALNSLPANIGEKRTDGGLARRWKEGSVSVRWILRWIGSRPCATM